MRVMALVLAGALAGRMTPDAAVETGPGNGVWQIQSIDGQPFTARGTVQFAEEGRIVGQAPCNRFFGTARLDWPKLEIGPLASTMMACPDLSQERRFLDALASVTSGERSGDTLILQGAVTLVFTRQAG